MNPAISANTTVTEGYSLASGAAPKISGLSQSCLMTLLLTTIHKVVIPNKDKTGECEDQNYHDSGVNGFIGVKR